MRYFVGILATATQSLLNGHNIVMSIQYQLEREISLIDFSTVESYHSNAKFGGGTLGSPIAPSSFLSHQLTLDEY